MIYFNGKIMEEHKNISVSEIWFNEHERIIVIRLNNKTLISSDIYCTSWNYPIDYKISINDKVCLIYHKISGFHQVDKRIEWVEIVGVMVDGENRKETVNLRILVKENLSDEYIRELVRNIKDAILAQCKD